MKINCQQCEIKFKVIPSRINKTKYCSSRCYGDSKLGKSNIFLVKEKIKKECIQCDRQFSVFPSHASRVMHCSRKCGNKTQSKKISGDKCHLWRGGIAYLNQGLRDSPQYKIWRLSIFKRDGFECQICSEVGKKINAHHIYKFSEYPEKRLEANNGITLCVECHNIINYKEGDWISYFNFNLDVYDKRIDI